MLTELKWMKLARYLVIETQQCKDENKDITPYLPEIEAILALPKNSREAEIRAKAIYEELDKIHAENPNEPNTLEDIQKLQKRIPLDHQLTFSKSELFNKVYGAWLGRVVGCLLGKPVECWKRSDIEGFLRDTGNYPVKRYLSCNIPEEIKSRYNISPDRWQYSSFIDFVDGMPEDDDTNYTVAGLKLVKTYGYDFTTDNVGEHWLANIPILSLCTAERRAYVNLCKNIYPPESAEACNPYREYIGAQIRADIFGYLCPGDPYRAAKMAYRDARLTHVKNGIYAEMFIAAAMAEAFCSGDIHGIIQTGLSAVPHTSRLYRGVSEVIAWYEQGITVEQAANNLHGLFDEDNDYHWCHSVSNAMMVAIALLWGGGDFEKTIGYSVMFGFDTDCNAATCGSILGLNQGADKIPAQWLVPLKDTIHSSIREYSCCRISAVAEETVELICKNSHTMPHLTIT